MDYREQFVVKPGDKVRLGHIDPSYKGNDDSADKGAEEIAHFSKQLGEHQAVLYAEKRRSVLIVLQALDAAGKDGTINHVFTAFNPQGARVVGFKQPTPEERAHDFLWRVHPHAPGKGEIAIFNRSHYEDVLVTRVHKLVDKETWTKRYSRSTSSKRCLPRTTRRSSSSSCTSTATSSSPASPSGSKIRRATGRSASRTTRSARCGTTTSRLSRTRWRQPAPSMRRGT